MKLEWLTKVELNQILHEEWNTKKDVLPACSNHLSPLCSCSWFSLPSLPCLWTGWILLIPTSYRTVCAQVTPGNFRSSFFQEEAYHTQDIYGEGHCNINQNINNLYKTNLGWIRECCPLYQLSLFIVFSVHIFGKKCIRKLVNKLYLIGQKLQLLENIWMIAMFLGV